MSALKSFLQTITAPRRVVPFLLLLVFSVFFASLNSDSAYSSDEVWSVTASSADYQSVLATLKADVHPPLYFLFLHEWISWVGTGERTVRSLSGLFYLLTVFSVYQLGKRLTDQSTALMSAAIYMCSPLAILSAQFARMYALLALLTVLSSWLYLQFQPKSSDSTLLFVAYVVINVMGTFTHVAFFFVLFGQGAFQIFFFQSEKLKRFLLAGIVSVIPYAVFWAPVLLRQISKSEEGLAWLKKPGLPQVSELLFLYGGAFWLLVPLIAFICWKYFYRLPSFKSQVMRAQLPLTLLACAVIIPILLSQFKPIFNPRFAIIGLPVFALSVGAFTPKLANYLLSAALILFTVVGFAISHEKSGSCDNRVIASYLNEVVHEGDVILFTSLTRMPIDYYLKQISVGKDVIESSFPKDIDKHPGYEGNFRDPKRQLELETEADQLLAGLLRTKTNNSEQRIFVFRGLHPEIDQFIERRLARNFGKLTGQGRQCLGSSTYFTDIVVYK